MPSQSKKLKIAVIGLGYVGLPLALKFAALYDTVGFDTSLEKAARFRGNDPADSLQLATSLDAIDSPDFVFIAVPTPVTPDKRPDLSALCSATAAVACRIRKGTVVVFESTVYPGVTEDICVPLLEKESELTWKRDFFVAYSPERINPGDELHSLETVTKIVAGDTPETCRQVAELYETIIQAPVYRAPNIRVAEGAKAIENAQRDLNIAFMNELALLFNRIGLDTQDVLDAAATKWNFLPFRPGLVGGHCIGVDPYYLTHCAEMAGYNSQVILAGRRINDGMGKYVAEQTVKLMISRGQQILGAKANILGFSFKEDCDDVRNTRVADIMTELHSYGIETQVYDPVADADAAYRDYGVQLSSWADLPSAHALIFAVPHKPLKNMKFSSISEKLLPGGCIADVKAVLDRAAVARAGFALWRL